MLFPSMVPHRQSTYRRHRLISFWIFGLLSLYAPWLPTVAAFAAKKKPNKKSSKKNSAASQKGFGAAPPSLDVIAEKFKTRLPGNALELPCPCGIGGDLYKDCCALFHNQEKMPKTPLRVLQTRYSAFFYRLIPYIMRTTHPSCRDYRENQEAWANDLNRKGMFDSFEFVKLNIGEEKLLNDNKATLDFQVRLRSRDGSDSETVVSEKSVFLRDPETYVWSYASGEVRSTVEGLEGTILNQ